MGRKTYPYLNEKGYLDSASGDPDPKFNSDIFAKLIRKFLIFNLAVLFVATFFAATLNLTEISPDSAKPILAHFVPKYIATISRMGRTFCNTLELFILRHQRIRRSSGKPSG